MAQKKITDLTLISALTATVNTVVDDGIQTYRATMLQIKNYVLASGNVLLSMLDDDIFDGLSSVTPAAGDYLVITDASDTNKTKKTPYVGFAERGYRAVSTYPDSVGIADVTLNLSGTAGTITLPTAVGNAGKRYFFVHSGTDFTAYTIGTTSSQTIGGVASGSFKVCTNGELLGVESDGANWIIIARRTDTGYRSYTPTMVGFGTVTINLAKWCRVGDRIICELKMATGTHTATEARWPLPTGVTSAGSDKIPGLSIAGYGARSEGTTTATITNLIETGVTYFTWGVWGSATVSLQKLNGNDYGSNHTFSVHAECPVADWQP